MNRGQKYKTLLLDIQSKCMVNAYISCMYWGVILVPFSGQINNGYSVYSI